MPPERVSDRIESIYSVHVARIIVNATEAVVAALTSSFSPSSFYITLPPPLSSSQWAIYLASRFRSVVQHDDDHLSFFFPPFSIDITRRFVI